VASLAGHPRRGWHQPLHPCPSLWVILANFSTSGAGSRAPAPLIEGASGLLGTHRDRKTSAPARTGASAGPQALAAAQERAACVRACRALLVFNRRRLALRARPRSRGPPLRDRGGGPDATCRPSRPAGRSRWKGRSRASRGPRAITPHVAEISLHRAPRSPVARPRSARRSFRAPGRPRS
jgi:hypothetical protein